MAAEAHSHIAVLGAGSWGTALALALARAGAQVHLWDRNKDLIQEMSQIGQNTRYMPGIPLDPRIQFFDNLEKALQNTSDVLIVVPSHAFHTMINQIQPMLQDQGVLWATKGLDSENGEFLHSLAIRVLGERRYAVLSGPSFAKEVAKDLPTAVTIASSDIQYATTLAKRFHSNNFRAYTTQDLIGVQLGGVVKNILAVAVGISDGLQLGANARAALITRGLAEMMRLGEILGARRETLMGLAGCGDVILTCTDNQSRNRRFGLALAEGLTEVEAMQKIGQVVEAVYNVEQLYHLAQKQSVELPILEQVFRVMKQGASPREAVTVLLARALKSE